MRRWMRWDCAAAPPGELIESATARMFFIENARSSERATLARVSPGLSGLEMRIAPGSRTTGTIGISLRRRAGISRRSTEGTFAKGKASPILSADMFGGDHAQ